MHHTAADLGPVARAVKLGDQLSAGERDERYDTPDIGALTPLPALQNPLAAPDTSVPVRPAPLSGWIALADLPTDAATTRQAYAPLCDLLRTALAEAAAYAGDDYTALADHLLGAVYRTAIAVPSAFQRSVADISLASHLHLAAAFAAALAHDEIAELTADEPAAGLVMGDLSGIQEFLHTVPAKGAARSLRARSFYLQLLSLVAARFVALRCGMPAPAVVMHAGGNFLVVVPKSQLARVAEVRLSLERAIFRAHGPRLAVALATTEVSPTQLDDFLAVRRRLAEALSTQKGQRYAASAEALGLFKPRPIAPVGQACRACGRDAEEWGDEGEGRLCSFCASVQAIGQRLPTERFLTIEDHQPYATGGWDQVFAALGVRVQLWGDRPPAPFAGAVFALDHSALQDMSCARYLPVGRAVPRYLREEPDLVETTRMHRAGELLDFDAIAGRSPGRPTLAVAKVDVDDLGLVLQQQFVGPRRASPSRYAAFSTYLSLFFEGYVNERAASRHFPSVYMVYAGGDDLLCAGPLDEVLRFLLEARTDFGRWAGHNPALHFSAGISVSDAHRPIVAGLEEAELLLVQSKAFARPGHRKDAITVSDWTGTWHELRQCLELRDQLLTWLAGEENGPDRAARSLLRRLQALGEIDPGDGAIRYGPTVWRTYYDLSRVAERHQALRPELERIYERALEPGGGRRIALAARLAEFATAIRDRITPPARKE